MRVQNEESVDLEAGEEICNHVVATHDNEMDAPGKPKIPASTLEPSPPLITLKVSRSTSIHRGVVVFFFPD
jgi:hypothetical protein